MNGMGTLCGSDGQGFMSVLHLSKQQSKLTAAAQHLLVIIVNHHQLYLWTAWHR